MPSSAIATLMHHKITHLTFHHVIVGAEVTLKTDITVFPLAIIVHPYLFNYQPTL